MGRYKVDPITGELTLMNPSMSDIPIYQGVSGSTASVSGLVPQAQAGDEEKALLGNGTWGTVAGGGQTISYADWLQLTPEEQAHGEYFIPDYSGSILPTGGFDNVPTAGSQNPVTSNGIYEVTKPFTGAQGSIAGIGGTVPAPSAGDGDKVLKGNGTWGTVDDTLNPASSNPIQNQAVAKPIEAMVNVYGSKNLLPNNATTQVVNGITFTVNSDGSITISGSNSNDAVYLELINKYPVKNFEGMILSAGGKNAAAEELGICVILQQTQISMAVFYRSYGEDIIIGEFTANEGRCAILVPANTTISSPLTLKPMIRDAHITDSTYVPYAMTNRDITKQITAGNIAGDVFKPRWRITGSISANDPNLMDLPAGSYMVSVDNTDYFPTRWGILMLFKTGDYYNTMLFSATNGYLYFRNFYLPDHTYYTNWRRINDTIV